MDDTTNLEGTQDRRPRREAASDEPFACPACGQMLASTCRICVACKQPVDPALIQRPLPPAPESGAEQELPVELPPVQFSWAVFFSVLSAWLFAAIVTQRFLGPEISQYVLGGIVILCSAWVFYDAQQKGLAKPLRWGIGVMLLWIVVFPWYLVRRRTPEAPCPFVEGEASPLARVLLFVVMAFLLLGIAILVFKGPPPH